ncbi:hypothetical protein C2E23DRAFT_890672 [Lenzites betulinus]|nr:hypothetical protein C2E23DRAFT_890672 [Lenzites betulinus]
MEVHCVDEWPGSTNGPPTWTTDEQRKWLLELKPAFQEARAKGRLGNWQLSVHHSWFLRWPERKLLFGENEELTAEQETELAKAETKRKTQINRWFQNHASESRTVRAAAAPLPREVLGAPKGKRAPHAREVYIRMYYDAAKRALVNAALDAARLSAGRALSHAETLTVTRRTINQLFEAEPPAVKEAVAARVVEETRLLAVPSQVPQAKNKMPEDYQRALNAAPGWIERVLAPIAEMCGWCISVVGAGPNPERGGEITSFACHFGTTPTGHTFDQVVPNFKDQFIRPMVHFAKGVYMINDPLLNPSLVDSLSAPLHEADDTGADPSLLFGTAAYDEGFLDLMDLAMYGKDINGLDAPFDFGQGLFVMDKDTESGPHVLAPTQSLVQQTAIGESMLNIGTSSGHHAASTSDIPGNRQETSSNGLPSGATLSAAQYVPAPPLPGAPAIPVPALTATVPALAGAVPALAGAVPALAGAVPATTATSPVSAPPAPTPPVSAPPVPTPPVPALAAAVPALAAAVPALAGAVPATTATSPVSAPPPPTPPVPALASAVPALAAAVPALAAAVPALAAAVPATTATSPALTPPVPAPPVSVPVAAVPVPAPAHPPAPPVPSAPAPTTAVPAPTATVPVPAPPVPTTPAPPVPTTPVPPVPVPAPPVPASAPSVPTPAPNPSVSASTPDEEDPASATSRPQRKRKMPRRYDEATPSVKRTRPDKTTAHADNGDEADTTHVMEDDASASTRKTRSTKAAGTTRGKASAPRRGGKTRK